MRPPGTAQAPTARQRARESLTLEIKAVARRQLGEVGSNGLSLRAVARELGMVSSAVYRYFASRDDLLTALIIDAYDAIGSAAEAADAEANRRDHRGRFMAIGRAIRAWALTNPHEYALIYGSPVPGYAAPQDTIGPATRTVASLTRLLADAVEADAIGAQAAPLPPIPTAVRADLTAIAAGFGPVLPAELLVRGVHAWLLLFGAVSFELFGQFDNAIAARDAFFDHLLATQANAIGLLPAQGRRKDRAQPA